MATADETTSGEIAGGEITTLAEAIGRYGPAYLITVSDAGAPHAVEVTARLDGGRLRVRGHGRRSDANAQARPAVTVLWPATAPGGHALLVDGTAAAESDVLALTVTRAVLHRAGDAAQATPPPAGGACVADCVELTFPAG